jgi:hypothetical protein
MERNRWTKITNYPGTRLTGLSSTINSELSTWSMFLHILYGSRHEVAIDGYPQRENPAGLPGSAEY